MNNFESRQIQVKIVPGDKKLNKFLSELSVNINYSVDEFLKYLIKFPNSNLSDSINFLFCLFQDLFFWGAEFEFYRSQLYITIPNLNNLTFDQERKSKIQESLIRLKNSENIFEESINQSKAIELLNVGSVRLLETQQNEKLTEIFKSGITTWSMPYRTREGRSLRFVLMLNSTTEEIPIGLLEIGDEAPINPPRDQLMGLNISYKDLKDHELDKLADRFYELRKSLRSENLPKNYKNKISELITDIENFREKGKGREGNFTEVSRKKKFTYLYRLLNAEAACRKLVKDFDGGFQDGLRVLRDLTVPRVNVEMVICGALPPFGNLLVGKLVASMGCHPKIRKFVDRDFGIITSSLFDPHKLRELLPNYGTLLLTTKGLYPGHSSQYNGVTFINNDLQNYKLKKIGDTMGQTTSHISSVTVKFANKVLESSNDRSVSRTFGSGGGKRQRVISEALRQIELPVELSHAYISRPIYAFSLVRNLDRVVLLNEKPDWIMDAYADTLDSEVYEQNTFKYWKEKWSEKIVKRASA